jgi:hypothetical protein
MEPCRTRLPFTVALLVLSTLCACGKGLNGNYLKCIPINANSSKTGNFTFLSDGVSFGYQSSAYPAANCGGTPGTPAVSTGTYVTASSSVSGASNITFTFGSGPLNRTTLNQIYKLDGSNLYLGDTSGVTDGTSDANRPVTLEPVPYVRQ